MTTWRDSLAIYIPMITTLQTSDNRDGNATKLDIPIQQGQVLLPSVLGDRVVWDKRLGEYEWQLREAQARDALHGIRQNMHMQDYLVKKKKNWSRGVRQNTRSQAVIAQTQKKTNSYATKYRVARAALSRLAPLLSKGQEWSSEFSVLQDEDIRGLPAEGLGEGGKILSWIWLTPGVATDDEAGEPQVIDGLSQFNPY